MNLKQRFSFIFSSLFSVLIGFVLLSIYLLFSGFRQEEFRLRLTQRAETTVKFLVGVKEINYHLLEIFDKNRVNRLYNEKTAVYNDRLQRIYTSNNSYKFNWSAKEFGEIDADKIVYRQKDNYEVIGIVYRFNGRKYYVLVSAEDAYENEMLKYLKYILLGSFFIGTAAVWSLSFYLSKASLKPLERLSGQIREISVNNLNQRLALLKNNQEINELAWSFNGMMDKIDSAYHDQKEFTANASHELRTPITRITSQLENIMQGPGLEQKIKVVLRNVSSGMYQLSDTLTSLLLLSEVSNPESLKSFSRIRIDEILFDTAACFSALASDFKFHFEVKEINEDSLEAAGDEALLKIVFMNLFKNAYSYSDNKTLTCSLQNVNGTINISLTNSGATPNVQHPGILFKTFVRGSNTNGKEGSGIGLSVVKRILQYHQSSIEFTIPRKEQNTLLIKMPEFSTLS